jgi:hypothetical protein
VIVTCSVDEQGCCNGFHCIDDEIAVGSFGDGLEEAAVELNDGRIGRVDRVYTRINTGSSGNYVMVDIVIE